MHQFKLFIYVFLSIILVGCFPNNNDSPYQKLILQGHTMGTTYKIIVVVPKEFDSNPLHTAIDESLKAVNQSMSTYIPDSELSLFNKKRTSEPVEISTGLRKVIKEALRLGEISQGKLDVTVGPLVNLWGFGPEYRIEKMPSEAEVEKAKNRIGINNLSLTDKGLSKSQPDIYIDLSTIAKGYGVDIIAELLEANGIHRYLVEIGGEMRLKGFDVDGTLWVSAIEKPISNERAVQQLIVPKDNAVATSGNYRNYFEEDGIRYSHIIDPDTAKPISHKLVSVTVIDPSSMTADGLSTAIMVLGPEKGLAFVEKNKLAALLIVKTQEGFEEIVSNEFMQYLK